MCGSSFLVFHKSADSVAPAFCAFPAGAAQAARSLLGALSAVRCAFSPLRAQPQFPTAPVRCVHLVFSRYPPGGCRPSRISGSLWLETGGLVGDAVSGAEFAPFPSPLPPASGTAGLVHSGLALLWDCSVPLFCERPAVCSDWLLFSLSLAIPQFKLLSHKSSLRLPSGHSGPVLTLSNAARSSPFHPHLLVADAGAWGTFLLGVAFRHVICGFYLFVFPPS